MQKVDEMPNVDWIIMSSDISRPLLTSNRIFKISSDWKELCLRDLVQLSEQWLFYVLCAGPINNPHCIKIPCLSLAIFVGLA